MKGVLGKTLVGRREAFDVHKKEILTTSSRSVQDSFSVRLIGLEPTRREAPDPKSGVSTNFTTPAKIARRNRGVLRRANIVNIYPFSDK